MKRKRKTGGRAEERNIFREEERTEGIEKEWKRRNIKIKSGR